jgi:hypothetical protein
MRDPCSLVHTCDNIEAYRISYAYPRVPLKSRVQWQNINVPKVYPPLYTRVMGRPKKTEGKLMRKK